MGLFCSKTGKDERSPLAARLSPFGRFGRRSFHKGKERRVWREDSLLGACLDVVVGTLHLQDPAALQALPLDLAQLLLDHLVETGKLNDAAVLCLQGQHFYQLNLDAYPEPIRDFWVRFLVRQSLESVVLSRTAVDDFVLSAFPPLPRLTSLHLDWCDGITDAGLVVLGRFPALEDLSLAGCDAIGPLTIGAISRLPRLRSLNLDACHRIWGLGPLRRLTNLQKLDLGWCNAIGDEDAAAIASLSTLMELRICHTALTDTGVAKLSTLTGLVALSIGGLSVADATLAGLLRAMPYLRRLDLERCTEAGDTTLRALAATGPPLEELSLAYTNMSDDVFKVALPRLRRLRRLDLDSSGVGDAGVQGLAGLPDLEVLDLSDTGVTNAGMLVVGMLPFIAQVNLSFTDVNDFGLQRLCKATTLRRLNLDSRHFTDAGLVHVARLPRLETLDLFGAQVTDAGCAVLANATTLTSLEVCSGAVTDAGVAKLAELASLRHLSLAQNFRVGNGAIPALMRLSHLTALNLSQCRVSTSAVVTLGCLPELQVLCLADTRVKPFAVEKLQAMNRNLEVKGVKMPEKH